MRRGTVSALVFAILFATMLILVFNIQVKASGTIYIRADGSVDPDTAPISTADNITYTFTDNISEPIVIERDNIVVDGADYFLQGTGSGTGIYLSDRSNVTIQNTEIKTFHSGIWLEYSSNSTISGNNITNNNCGVFLEEAPTNTILHNTIRNNDHAVVLYRSSNYTYVGGNKIEDNSQGVDIEYSSYNIIFENDIANIEGGIHLEYCNNSIIHRNNITNNGVGIRIDTSYNNTINENIVANNDYGITFDECSSNFTIYGNTIRNNVHGIFLAGFSFFYHNNFVDNLEQVHSCPEANIWNASYPSGGNYWSDYSGTDEYVGVNQNLPGSDGIGDTPYVIDENNQDNYPLMNPWSPPTPPEVLEELIETIEAWNLPKGTEKSLISKLEGILYLLDKGNENGAIHKLMGFINQVAGLRGKKLTNEQADYLILETQRIIDLIEECMHACIQTL